MTWLGWTCRRIRTKLLTVGYEFLHNNTKRAHDRSEEAAVFDLIGRDRSVKHVVAFAGDRTDRGGEMSTMHKHLLALTDFATSLSIDSFRFVLVSFFGDPD
jgi:hypothetical protein